jgi:hypothetical protein
LSQSLDPVGPKFDRTNAYIAAGTFLTSFIVYALTVQPSFSFWDCGEFVACAYTLGIPHPPGTPLFVLLGRVIALIPFVEDISHRINYLSVVSSAGTALFSYLLGVRMIRFFFNDGDNSGLNRYICYIGGIAGAFFVAFSATNWGNSVEAEVYGLALMLSVAIVWVTLRYLEVRGTPGASKWIILAFYMAMLGIGIHMTVFLVVPVCALFFILKKEATARDWMLVCSFVALELFLVIVMANGRGTPGAYLGLTAILGLGLLGLLWRKINWAILIAIATTSTLMLDFSTYFKVAPIGLGVLIVLALLSKQQKWGLHWRTGMAIMVIGFLGISVHAYIPIRSELNPRIDENNPSRDWRTFVNYLDRKQYGQTSMIDRMFNRRGSWSNQFGRHPHMGFWSYFEEQYSSGGWQFILPFFLLGLIGLITAIYKRLEIGLPFFTLFLMVSVGLILYMNFADGTKYSFRTGDAYLEVRNRDYFFTPAFVFFGIAMGMGIGAVMKFLKDKLAGNSELQRKLVLASGVLVLLPAVSLAHNWYYCDRSNNYIPYNYAKNLLDTCEKDAILFTSGDNDTFPLWCMQETYNYRRDVRIANLSLLNTDWYVEQMKNRYDVPISLSDEQILWHSYEAAPGIYASRPTKMFNDRSRQRSTYLQALPYEGRVVRVQDMMVDDIVWECTYTENDSLKLKYPIYFSSGPYTESPLQLSSYVHTEGLLYRLDWSQKGLPVDTLRGYDLFMNQYVFDGYSNSDISREENATGVFIAVGVNSGRLFDELIRNGSRDKAVSLVEKMIDVYPEYWQSYLVLADLYDSEGDSTAATDLWYQLHDTLTSFLDRNPINLFYMQDLGITKVELGRRIGDDVMVNDGVELCWKAFKGNPNSNYGFRKLITVLSKTGRYAEVQEAAKMFAEYGVNQSDPFLQQILGIQSPPPAPRAGG